MQSYGSNYPSVFSVTVAELKNALPGYLQSPINAAKLSAKPNTDCTSEWIYLLE